MLLDLVLSALHGLVVFFAGYFWHGYVMRQKEKNSKPYIWACLEEDCDFKIASNSAELTLNIADGHTTSAHKSY